MWSLDVLYLISLSVVGTIGNLLIISSIIYQRRVNKNGNIFIINLAVADLIVTGFVIPIGVANVITGRDVLSDVACVVAGFLLCVSCACSVSNLACIAFNRYWYVARHDSYRNVFSRKVVYVLVMMNWIWAVLLVTPTLLGWSKQHYDKKVMFCTFNLGQSPSYNIFLSVFGIALPIIITAVSYCKLFAAVSKRWNRRRKWTFGNFHFPTPAEKNKAKKQWNFTRTLLITVLALLMCFLPYSITTFVDQTHISPTVSKIVGRLVLTNFTANFVIYGAMNPIYREGYMALIRRLFCLKKSIELKSSEMAVVDSSPTCGVKMNMQGFRKTPNCINLHCGVRGKEPQS